MVRAVATASADLAKLIFESLTSIWHTGYPNKLDELADAGKMRTAKELRAGGRTDADVRPSVHPCLD